jgi:hypothetical protein
MRKIFGAFVLLTTLVATDASAQWVNLTGQYRCVQVCQLNPALPAYVAPNGSYLQQVGPAYVTQNGWNLNLVNEVGVPSRAWIDYPGHIWAENWGEGAIYSPDGLTIQFDRSGTIWRRELPVFVPQ